MPTCISDTYLIPSPFSLPLSSPWQCTSWILVACTTVSSLWGSQEPLTREMAEVSVRTGLNTGEFSEGQWWGNEGSLRSS